MSLASQITLLAERLAAEFVAQAMAIDIAKSAVLVYTYPGTLVVNNTGPRLPIPALGFLISNVAIQVRTAPTGASLIVDVNKNGSTIFTTGKPTIAASGTQDLTSTPTSNPTTCVSGDYLTVDIDQVGSSVAGADLVVMIEGILG